MLEILDVITFDLDPAPLSPVRFWRKLAMLFALLPLAEADRFPKLELLPTLLTVDIEEPWLIFGFREAME